MSARLLDGKKLAAEVRAEVAAEAGRLAERGVVPGLAAVLVGEDPGSQVYVNSKKKAAEAAGMHSEVHALPATASQEQVLEMVRRLNADPAIHGMIVQLPLPEGLDAIAVQEAMDPAKDVDGLHPENAGLLGLGRPRFVPCTPLGVQALLARNDIEIPGAHVVVVGRSNLVGRPISILLSNKGPSANATVTLCHTGTRDMPAVTRTADILVVAAGIPRAITGDMIRRGAAVMDVGINRVDGKLVGDVEFESAVKSAGAITPVPGGVGPMTVAMLLRNTVQAAGGSF